MAAVHRWVAPRVVLPSIDDDGCIDLATSMIWAIPRDHLLYFVAHGAGMAVAMASLLSEWRRSVNAAVVRWDGAYVARMGPGGGSSRVSPVAVNTSALLTHPLVPLWCRVVPTREAADALIQDGGLAWHFDGEVDDWDGANLVSLFEACVVERRRAVGSTPPGVSRKRKPDGHQDWSESAAMVRRRAHPPLDVITGILLLVKAVSGGIDIPDLLIFNTTAVVILDPSIIRYKNDQGVPV